MRRISFHDFSFLCMAAAPFYDFAMIFIPLPILPRPSIAAASIGYPSPSPLLDALNSPSIAIFISPLSDVVVDHQPHLLCTSAFSCFYSPSF
jgi:hypothetical protein